MKQSVARRCGGIMRGEWARNQLLFICIRSVGGKEHTTAAEAAAHVNCIQEAEMPSYLGRWMGGSGLLRLPGVE